jgi:hypothetical protein
MRRQQNVGVRPEVHPSRRAYECRRTNRVRVEAFITGRFGSRATMPCAWGTWPAPGRSSPRGAARTRAPRTAPPRGSARPLGPGPVDAHGAVRWLHPTRDRGRGRAGSRRRHGPPLSHRRAERPHQCRPRGRHRCRASRSRARHLMASARSRVRRRHRRIQPRPTRQAAPKSIWGGVARSLWSASGQCSPWLTITRSRGGTVRGCASWARDVRARG